MRLLVLLCLIGVSYGVPPPAFRYVYTIPQEREEQPWWQFNQRGGENYVWGYEFPGRAHFETSDAGNVKGTFGYVDAFGSPVIWRYTSHPNIGFQVETETGQAPEQAIKPLEEKEPEALTRTQLRPTRYQQVEDSIGPLLKSAAYAGEVFPAGSSPVGTPQYAVLNEVAEEVGSVSAIAERFGAIPVAAVHDVQSRPTFGAPQSAFAPVLVHKEQPDITLYTLEVPLQ